MAQHQRRVFIRTYGCQMNVYDSGRMADALAPMGYAQTTEPDDADIVVLNTCHIREKASEKVYSELGRFQRIKSDRQRRGRKTLVVVAGCVAQAEGKEILARAPIVDVIVGPQSYHRLPELLFRASQEVRGVIDVDFPVEDKFTQLPPVRKKRQQRTAFLTVQEGCDKFCTFCVVPYTRGAETSRPVAQVVAEAERLIDAGVVELTLLGQNVNAYHGAGPDGGDWTLAQLLRHLSGLEGLERLRYTTSHPIDMTPDLIAAHGKLDKLMPYLHLPFQAGSDRVLAAMNRRHRISDYLKIIDELRSVRPDIALSTDIIVGFPGETEQDFAETLSVVRKVRFAQAYSFKYSPRPGTPGANLAEQVADEVKTARLARLQTVLAEHQLEFNNAVVGRSLPVLFDRKGKKPGQIQGRSPYLQAVHVQGADSSIGQILPVRVLDAGPNSLTGVIESVFDDADPLAAMTAAPSHSAGGHL